MAVYLWLLCTMIFVLLQQAQPVPVNVTHTHLYSPSITRRTGVLYGNLPQGKGHT